MKKLETYKNIVFLSDIEFALILASLTVVIFLILFFTIFVKFSNNGSLIWKSYPIKYIDIEAPADINFIIEKDSGPVITKKILNVNGKEITLTYSNNENIPLFNILTKKIDHMKLLEYSLRTVIKILYGSSDKFRPENISVSFNKKTNNEFAGANTVIYDNSNYLIQTNFEFIEKIYNNTDYHEFIIYYVGLFIHEFVHVFLGIHDPNVSLNDSDNFYRIQENIPEYVRMISGFLNPNFYLRKSNKKLPTFQYGAEGAYFMHWLNTNYPGTIIKFIKNLSINVKTTDQLLLEISGKTLQQLFADFQNDLP